MSAATGSVDRLVSESKLTALLLLSSALSLCVGEAPVDAGSEAVTGVGNWGSVSSLWSEEQLGSCEATAAGSESASVHVDVFLSSSASSSAFTSAAASVPVSHDMALAAGVSDGVDTFSVLRSKQQQTSKFF